MDWALLTLVHLDYPCAGIRNFAARRLPVRIVVRTAVSIRSTTSSPAALHDIVLGYKKL